MKRIADIVNKDLISIQKNTTFPEIIKIMKEKRIGKIPVIEHGKVIGIVLRDDILIKQEKAPIQPVIAFWEVIIALPGNKDYEEKVKKISAYTANEIMNTKINKCQLEDKIENIVTDMLENKKDYVLVFDEDILYGIITKSDLISKGF